MPASALCDRCGRSATFRVSEAGVERWICESCLETVLGAIPLSEIAVAMVRAPRNQGTCPYCQTTAGEVAETGLAGCPLCYESLGDGLWRKLELYREQWSRIDVW